jgi:hypothetical protein
MNKYILITVLLTLSIVGSNAEALSKSETYSSNSVEKLVNYELVNGYMTIKVLTAGCTGINSFKIVADGNELSVVRVKQDACGMKPRPMTLRYSVRHLGLDDSQAINIVNKRL